MMVIPRMAILDDVFHDPLVHHYFEHSCLDRFTSQNVRLEICYLLHIVTSAVSFLFLDLSRDTAAF